MSDDCGCPRRHIDCGLCGDDGVIELPAGAVTCPACHPEAYPGGFPGIRAPAGHWLVPPTAVVT